MCHSERSENELLRTLSEKSEYISVCFQILRFAQDDTLKITSNYWSFSFSLAGLR